MHEKAFKKLFVAPKSSTSPFVKCFYCARKGHTASTCYFRNPSSRINVKQIWVPKGTYVMTNNKGPNQIWVPKRKV